MDDRTPIRIRKEALRSPTRITQAVKTKGTLLYPETSEREYARIALKHVRFYGEVLKKYLPEIEKIIEDTQEEPDKNIHMDENRILEFSYRFSRTIRRMEKELASKLDDFDTKVFIEKVAKKANSNNIRQWQKLIKKTFGVDIDGFYYNKGTWADLIDRWTADNVGYVKSIPQESLVQLRQLIQDGYNKGWGVIKMRNEIMKAFGVSKSKAKMLAVDQMGTLCAQITRKQQTDAGCTHYRWKARHDNRVRESHREYNGKIFAWDNPPPSWYMTKSRGKVYTGRFCNPGEDYYCRCVAIPIFNMDVINLPLKASSGIQNAESVLRSVQTLQEVKDEQKNR